MTSESINKAKRQIRAWLKVYAPKFKYWPDVMGGLKNSQICAAILENKSIMDMQGSVHRNYMQNITDEKMEQWKTVKVANAILAGMTEEQAKKAFSISGKIIL